MSAAAVAYGGPVTRVLVASPAPGLERVRPVPGESSPIYARALDQHAIFRRTLAQNGIETIELEPHFGPAIADFGVMTPRGVLIMRPSDERRRRDIAEFERVLAARGIAVAGRIEAPATLDGGDVMVAPDAIYVAVPRGDRSLIGVAPARRGNGLGRAALAAAAAALDLPVLEVEVAAHIERLRCVATMLGDRRILVAPSVVDVAPFAAYERFDVPAGDDYGAGVLYLGNGRAIANLRFRSGLPILRRAKVHDDAIDMWEFGKIGITPSLLALAV